VWAEADTDKLERIVHTVLMIHHIAVEQQDLTALLDNLIRLEQLLVLSADNNLWSDVGRALLRAKPNDSELLKSLNQLKSAIDGTRHGPSAIDGLSSVGKQLAQRLTDREQKQEWLKKF